MGGEHSTLAQGDPDSNPSKVQLAIIDPDYDTAKHGAPYEPRPWSDEELKQAVQVRFFLLTS